MSSWILFFPLLVDKALVLTGVFRQVTFKVNIDVAGSMTIVSVTLFYSLFLIFGAFKKKIHFFCLL